MKHSRRRQMLLAASIAVLAPRLAPTQERLRRVACLFGGSPKTHGRALDAFRLGLKEFGWVEGRNMVFDLHWAEGRLERISSLAAELVRSKPDVILTAANPIVVEIKKATASIPIVMATGADPVEWGLVASLARPGGDRHSPVDPSAGRPDHRMTGPAGCETRSCPGALRSPGRPLERAPSAVPQGKIRRRLLETSIVPIPSAPGPADPAVACRSPNPTRPAAP